MKKILLKAAIMGGATYLGLFCVYWFNLENKLIFYGLRPILNKIYENRDKKREIGI